MTQGHPNINNHLYKNSVFYLLFLLSIVCIAYWPLSLHIFSLKNDALNYFLPVRRLVSESYYNGNLPLWTPYLNLGYPLHGDMQSGVWNPFVQLFSMFGPYTLYTLQLETLFYIYLSGVGMFFLLKYFKVHPYANILTSIAYMLCGFNSDSCQFLNWITGASCLPFLFLFYYRFLEERKIIYIYYTAITLFVFFTSAYPADFIIAAYLMAAMFLTEVFKKRKQTGRFVFNKNIFFSHLLLFLVFILLSLPAILSYIQSLPLTERGSGASYRDVMSNSLHPGLLSSYTTPLGIWKMPEVQITDPLERNSFIGILGFVLLVTAFTIKTANNLIKFCKWAIFIFLLFSLGEIAGIRIIAYYLLPLMNTFRHPANAKLFTTFFACILIAFTFNSIISGQIKKIQIKTGFIITWLILICIIVYSLFTPFNLFSTTILNDLNRSEGESSFIQFIKNKLDQLSFADIVFINSLIQAPFLYFAWYYLVKKTSLRVFLALAIINCVLFTILFHPFTVIKTQKASYVQQIINENKVEGYPIPELSKSLYEFSKDNEKLINDIGCLNLYNKKVGRSEYRISPSNLLSQNEFWFNKDFRNLLMKYPLIYKADKAGDIKNWQSLSSGDTQSKWAFFEEKNKIETYENSHYQIILTKFNSNRIEGIIKSEQDGDFILLQNHYPRWQLFIDGKKEKLTKANISFMGFSLKSGNHHFEFIYKDFDIKLSFIISLITLFFIGLLPFIYKKH